MTIMGGYHRLVTAIVLISTATCKPVAHTEDRDSSLPTHRDDLMALRLRDNEQQSRDTEEIFVLREKRHIISSNEIPEILINKTSSNETSFEDYEKEYLINLTMNLLKEFLHYDNYLKHLKEENSSIRKETSTSNPAVTHDPVMPTALPISGDTTTPDDVRIDTRILQQKLSELNGLNVNQLTRVFNNLHRAAEQGVEDPGIAGLCCNIG